jgi:hypothetical protein
MEDREKVALRFISSKGGIDEEIVNTREWDQLIIHISNSGSVLMSYDEDMLRSGQADCSLIKTVHLP